MLICVLNISRVLLIELWVVFSIRINYNCRYEKNNRNNKCKETKASVNFENCSFDENYGSDRLEVIWTDTEYTPDQNTFYYARAIENPTCRWSTYDSIRIDEKPAKNYPKITCVFLPSPVSLLLL